MTDRETEHIEELREEARYRRERLALYKLRELQRGADGAAAPFRQAEQRGSATRPSR